MNQKIRKCFGGSHSSILDENEEIWLNNIKKYIDPQAKIKTGKFSLQKNKKRIKLLKICYRTKNFLLLTILRNNGFQNVHWESINVSPQLILLIAEKFSNQGYRITFSLDYFRKIKHS